MMPNNSQKLRIFLRFKFAHLCLIVSLSFSLLAGDDVDFNPTSNGIYYKLHLPADVRPNFDLTFSGYTLSELNGPGSRIAAVKHLLKCTKKYLVFVENGTLR